MIDRSIASAVKDLIGKYPVIVISGPRQGGKTTMIKSLFHDLPYINLESPDVRSKIEADPRGLFAQYGHRIVIDEVQRLPELFSYIQPIADEDRDSLFVLSGSQNFLMMEKVSQSLAGRAAIFYLLPFTLRELSLADKTADDWIFDGFYPRIYDRQIPPGRFYQDYLETYLQRDVRQIKNIGNLTLFNRFLGICAGYIGQILNYNNMANDVGVSVNTIKSWISVLETSFIVYQLPPYFRNFNKRITKSPKLYFYDTGLACAVLNIKSSESLKNYFQRGALFENFIINEYVKYYFNRGEKPPLFYWRDSNGNEIDLVVDLGSTLVPIEIKASQTFSTSFFKNINKWKKVVTTNVSEGVVVYGGKENWVSSDGQLVSWHSMKEAKDPAPFKNLN